MTIRLGTQTSKEPTFLLNTLIIVHNNLVKEWFKNHPFDNNPDEIRLTAEEEVSDILHSG